MTSLVLLSYGSVKEYRRAVLAVLSFFSYFDDGESTPDVRVVIFTDTSEFFTKYLENLPAEYVILTPEQQTHMMGAVSYRHRIKAVVIGDTLLRFKQDNLLFFDSDTFFMQHPGPLLARIRPGVSLMHTVEFTFNDNAHVRLPQGKTVADFVATLEGNAFQTTCGEERFSGTQQCWNSGVLGLAPSVIPYLPDVFQLIDYLYVASHWHIVEQIAFSLVLQTRDIIEPTDDYVYHYWQGNQKAAADALLATSLNDDFLRLPPAEQTGRVQQLVRELPHSIPAYLAAHREIGLRDEAINHFNAGSYGAGYRAALTYLLRKPTDRKFIKDVLYHTRRRIQSR